ncbi:MAG TPA: D-glycerate dehydrogenase [Patescibacteria group bacterium]|nr:D-glycerate dehydrogenase [Patescibacteria group bacterium]
MSMRPNIVVVRKLLPPAFERLVKAGEIRCWEGEGVIPRRQLEEWVRDADALMAAPNVLIDDSLLAMAPRLRVVAQPAVGYDNIDVAACTRRGIPVGNTPGVLVEATADLAFGLVLCAARRIHEGWDFVRRGEWTGSRNIPLGMDLSGKTMGIVGMGQIGAAVARRARSFNLEVVYHNRQRRQDEADTFCRYLELDELLQQADIVVVLLPLTPATAGLFGQEQFRRMKPSAVFVNAARGGIVDTAALQDALRQGSIAYAALDVTDPEPLPADHPLLQIPNLLVTPHIGSATRETRLRMAELAVDNVLAGLSGERLPAVVDARVYESR